MREKGQRRLLQQFGPRKEWGAHASPSTCDASTPQVQAALDRRYRLEPYVEEPLFSITKAVVRRLVKQVISNVKRELCPSV